MTTYTVNMRLLRAKMLEKDVSVAAMASACGIDKSTLYKRMRGDTQFTMGEIQAIMKRLELSSEDVTRIFLS